PPPVDPDTDPFREGNEDLTPPEVFALRPGGGAANGPGWRVRVVPNLYPSLEPALDGGGPASADPLGAGRGEPDLFPVRPADGVNEVIVNAPEPVGFLSELETDQVQTAAEAWRERMRAHADAAFVHVSVNEGKGAGAARGPASRTTGRSLLVSCTTSSAGLAPCSAPRRRSTSGCGRRPAGPSISAGESTSCRA